MPLYLKDPEIDRVARELAKLEGTTLTEAVSRALADRRERLLADREARKKRIGKLLEEIWALPVLDRRQPDEMLYDEDGLPK